MATDQRPKQDRLTLGPEDHGRLLSAEEFTLASYAEPWNYEREEGRLVVMAPDGEEHDNASEPWRDLLGAYKLSHPERVQRVVSEAWVRVSQGTDRIGDIGVYLVSDQQVQPIPDRAADLMFEIVSPGREARERDYIKKREDYYRIGVKEYVIIDRMQKKVTVLTHTPAGYGEVLLTLSDTYTTALLPGLAISLGEVMAP